MSEGKGRVVSLDLPIENNIQSHETDESLVPSFLGWNGYHTSSFSDN